MTGYFALVRDKLSRQPDMQLGEIASKAIAFARDAVTAARALRKCTRVGAGARSTGRPSVVNDGSIVIGRNLRLNCRWSPVRLGAHSGGELLIGDDVTINYGTLLSASSRVKVGNRVMIGSQCIIADSEVPEAPGAGEAIEIGDDVWLAVRVTVLPGARIGAGAVITAGSIVAGEIPPGVVAGGIPARAIRTTQAAAGADGPRIDRPKTPRSPEPTDAAVALRGTLVSDFTISELATQLALLPDAPRLAAEVAPFGQVVQVLMQGTPSNATDFAVVWTRPEAVVPSFARLVDGELVSNETLLDEVDQFCELVKTGTAQYRFAIVPTWILPEWVRGPALLDVRQGGVSHALALMNLRLGERLSSSPHVSVLNAQRWLTGGGKAAPSPKLWYLGKIPFSASVFAEAARDIQGSIAALTGQARKLLVLDLDDTLWGGIVGDDGWENLRLGGHDGLGEAFTDFQRAIKALTRRGIVLAIVSKNDESTALDAIRKHPEMVLKEQDFATWRINWRDKARNILELTNELKLGLQSVVFIDDNPVERARVREELPEVFVPEWPEDKFQYTAALAALRCFETGAISAEDAARTSLYAAERQRERLQATMGSLDDWLQSLDIKVRAEPLAHHNVQRTVQLLNKTNQMNLSTRRLSESELLEWSSEPSRRLWAVTVGDRFGEAGLTGILGVEIEEDSARIVDFVLSCRVMGRKVENAMVHLAVEFARERGAEQVKARLIPTKKNAPCLSFWESSGFAADGEQHFTWDARSIYPLPDPIALEWQR